MTSAVRKLLTLDWTRRRRLAEAALLHSAAVVVLRIVPFGLVQRLLRRTHRSAPAPRRRPSRLGACDVCDVETIAWAVRTVAAAIPLGSTCLTRAIAADLMLKRRGFDSVVRFGVGKNGNGRLPTPFFHAWVECDTRTIVGGEERDAYDSLDATAARIANSTALAGN